MELGRSWRNTNRLDHVHYSTEQYTIVQYSTLIGVESCAHLCNVKYVVQTIVHRLTPGQMILWSSPGSSQPRAPGRLNEKQIKKSSISAEKFGIPILPLLNDGNISICISFCHLSLQRNTSFHRNIFYLSLNTDFFSPLEQR